MYIFNVAVVRWCQSNLSVNCKASVNADRLEWGCANLALPLHTKWCYLYGFFYLSEMTQGRMKVYVIKRCRRWSESRQYNWAAPALTERACGSDSATAFVALSGAETRLFTRSRADANLNVCALTVCVIEQYSVGVFLILGWAGLLHAVPQCIAHA